MSAKTERARAIAWANGNRWKLVAIIRRRNSPVRMMSNTNIIHAEARIAKHIRKGDILEVIRFSRKTGKLTMAKPCPKCQEILSKTPVVKILYSDWDGKMRKL